MRPTRRQLDDVDVPTLASARLSRIEFEGRILQVYEWGPTAGAAPHSVLLLHGWGSHAPRWTSFIEGILARGWRAIAFDAPAHGRSEGSRSSLWQFCGALDRVIQANGPIDAILAHSLGALALANRLADVSSPLPRAAVLASLPPDLGFLLDTFLNLIGTDDDFSARVHARFTARFGRPAASFDSLSLAPNIRTPVLLLHDRDDDITPAAHATLIAPQIPNAALFLTQGCGHSGLLRDAAAVGAALGFLDGHLRRPA
ncbi:MAG: hypothetical protein RLZZ200_2354 [Pseudomonadota bacterium]|jgi:pimeloyl-ACP methyl ester carboxylesterase